MNEKTGTVFSIACENQPIPSCTASKAICTGDASSIVYFSLAPHTDISQEVYDYHKLIIVVDGTLIAHANGGSAWACEAGDAMLTPTDVPVGMLTDEGCVYVEVEMSKESNMSEALKAGEVLKLADLLPYQDGKVVSMDLANSDAIKFAVMSFDAGTGLSEHAAPGDALVFALEGEGIIGYEGEEHLIKAGENFKFAKGGKHYVKAEQRFKMALLISFEQ